MSAGFELLKRMEPDEESIEMNFGSTGSLRGIKLRVRTGLDEHTGVTEYEGNGTIKGEIAEGSISKLIFCKGLSGVIVFTTQFYTMSMLIIAVLLN